MTLHLQFMYCNGNSWRNLNRTCTSQSISKWQLRCGMTSLRCCSGYTIESSKSLIANFKYQNDVMIHYTYNFSLMYLQLYYATVIICHSEKKVIKICRIYRILECKSYLCPRSTNYFQTYTRQKLLITQMPTYITSKDTPTVH